VGEGQGFGLEVREGGNGRGGHTVLMPPGLFRYGPNPVCVYTYVCTRVSSCACVYACVFVCAYVCVCASMLLCIGTKWYNLEHDPIRWLHHCPDENCKFLFHL
jgi:hypothetical protein